MKPGPRVGIVGAGIVGITTACLLAEHGLPVTVLDPEDPGEGGASKGNAAHVIPSVIDPLASPATLRRAVRLLVGRDSPLIIPPARALGLAPWLLAFARASTPSRWRRGVTALAGINGRAHAALEGLLARAGLSGMMTMPGAIQVHHDAASLDAGLAELRAVPEALTGGVEALDPAALYAAEPALGPGLAGGVRIPATGVLADPLDVVRGLAGYARRLGAVIRRARVEHVRPLPMGGELAIADGGTLAFDRVVVAAGVWSGPMLRDLGEPQPLEAERGYNLTLPLDRPAIRHALVFADRGVVATQVAPGLRLGGWDELGGVARPPDPRIFARMETLASDLLPGFGWAGAERWMGHRPSLPDSLPVIAPSRRHLGIVYAFGHGHLGMTQSAATAEAVAALLTGSPPPFDLSPFALRY